MRKLIQKLLLCLTVFTLVVSSFGGSVALAATIYYKSGQSIGVSSGVNIHKNNFLADATVITYTMSINNKDVGTWDIPKKTAFLSSYAQSSVAMQSGSKVVKETGNTVTVKACYRKGNDYRTYGCKQATATGLTGKQVDTKTFKLNIDKSGKVTLKY